MTRFVAVTPNPAIDVTYRVAHQTVGETLRVQDVRRLPGGKGLNVARVLAALGRDVLALQPLGGRAGEWMASAIAELGIETVNCEIDGGTRTTVAVVDGSSHPTVLAEPGPVLAMEAWAGMAAALRGAVRAGDWVIIAGSFPPGSREEHLEMLVAAARAEGAFVAVDTSGRMLSAAAAARVDLLKANEQEILEALGAADAGDAVARLSRSGAMVMMSRGSRGALLVGRDGAVVEHPAVPDVHGNPTGAGDAATAGLVAALAEGHASPIALAWAAVCGAAAVLSPGAGEIDPGVIPELAGRLDLPPESVESLYQKRSPQ